MKSPEEWLDQFEVRARENGTWQETVLGLLRKAIAERDAEVERGQEGGALPFVLGVWGEFFTGGVRFGLVRGVTDTAGVVLGAQLAVDEKAGRTRRPGGRTGRRTPLDPLFKAILDDPGDELLRSAYADWLEERGRVCLDPINGGLHYCAQGLPWLCGHLEHPGLAVNNMVVVATHLLLDRAGGGLERTCPVEPWVIRVLRGPGDSPIGLWDTGSFKAPIEAPEWAEPRLPSFIEWLKDGAKPRTTLH